jgi:hypothetical protein
MKRIILIVLVALIAVSAYGQNPITVSVPGRTFGLRALDKTWIENYVTVDTLALGTGTTYLQTISTGGAANKLNVNAILTAGTDSMIVVAGLTNDIQPNAVPGGDSLTVEWVDSLKILTAGWKHKRFMAVNQGGRTWVLRIRHLGATTGGKLSRMKFWKQ